METNIERYKNVCRICVCSANDMKDLFMTEIKGMELAEMLSICIKCTVSGDDGLPRLICTGCLINLEVAYEFQELCRRSAEEIRYALSEIHDKKDIVPCEETTINVSSSPRRLRSSTIVNVESIKDEPSINSMSLQIEPMEQTDIIIKTVENEEDGTQPKDTNFDVSEEVVYSEVIAQKKESKPKKEYKCDVCNKTFNKPYCLLRHSNIHNADGKPFECVNCHKRFASESNLTRHMIIHSGLLTITPNENSFKCRVCEREFLKQESLAAHMQTHAKHQEGATEFQCHYCSKSFSKLNKLTRHMKIHADLKRFTCNMCGKTFVTSGQLIDHLNEHKGIKPHECHVCHKGFRQSCTLKDHMRTHSGETPFLCSQCGKAFNNGSNLRQHLIRHAGTKPFACKECPSRFSCKGGLKSHMTTHTGLKPYACDLCGSSFTKPYSLVKHKRIHSGERPYACEMCEMRFTSSDHVKRHMRTHTGEKPYKCKFCDRAFAQSNDLVKHLRSHIGENTYQCTVCPKAFRLHSELREHSKVHYLEQKDSNGTQTTPSESMVENGRAEPLRIAIPSKAIIKIDGQAMDSSVTRPNIIQLIDIQTGIQFDSSRMTSKAIIISPGQIVTQEDDG